LYSFGRPPSLQHPNFCSFGASQAVFPRNAFLALVASYSTLFDKPLALPAPVSDAGKDRPGTNGPVRVGVEREPVRLGSRNRRAGNVRPFQTQSATVLLPSPRIHRC